MTEDTEFALRSAVIAARDALLIARAEYAKGNIQGGVVYSRREDYDAAMVEYTLHLHPEWAV